MNDHPNCQVFLFWVPAKRISLLMASLAFFGWIPLSALARPMRLEPNVREGCRQALTGAYITAYDDKERQRHFVRILKEKLAEAETALQKAIKEHQVIRGEKAKASYDTILAEKEEAASIAVRTYEDQKEVFQNQLSQAIKEQELAENREKELRKILGPILTIKRFEDRPDGGYPIETSYKSPCPPYRALCLLPQKDIEHLSKIRIDGELPKVCQRYISLGRSPIPPPLK